MDVSIAVTLIRGQMGAVVERAVNVAVETVLSEMLKVVGVKFEEVKSQVALMKRELGALQREKVQREKESDNVRAKLRYTELKLKYYRQGVEEELQQRSSASGLVHLHPPAFPQAQRDGGAGVSSTEASASLQTGTSADPECTSSHGTGRHPIRARGQSDVGVASFDAPDFLLPASRSMNTSTESSLDSSAALFCPAERDPAQIQDRQADCKWTVVLPPPHATGLQNHPDLSAQADSSTLPSSAPQVKQEQQEEEVEEVEEVICIKEEPEEVQEVMATLLLDCQMQQQGYLQESEEYKLRRNELRRRSINRRRELEKTLPQPLLANLVRERREKTRLRVARWRAKRKLQDGTNPEHAGPHFTAPPPAPLQALGGAAGLSPSGFPIVGQHQQLRVTCASALQLPPPSGFLSNTSTASPFILPSSSSSSSLLMRGHSMVPHQHTVSLLQQSVSLTDADVVQ
ncbi:hypothetical protein EYF80_040850 [Liparis tanakae]|uniref:Uncharacterized protein n=1 Tax=Liparis tanakae TaxID=230148 RepID=A0A4Z2G761_9TELE|nr:hypothetical protein EYF80_040850 [Liparis tanakae]